MQGKRGNLQESYQLFVLRFLSFELKDQKESQEMAKWKFSKRWWEQIKRAIFLVMLFKEMELYFCKSMITVATNFIEWRGESVGVGCELQWHHLMLKEFFFTSGYFDLTMVLTLKLKNVIALYIYKKKFIVLIVL